MITRLTIESLRLAARVMKRKSMPPGDVASVALIELTGLGDVMSMLPSIYGFPSVFPGAKLRLIVDARFAELLNSFELPVTAHGVVAPRSVPGTLEAVQLVRGMRPSVACSMSPPRRNALVALASGAPAVAGYLRYTDSLAPYLLETPLEVFGLPSVPNVKFAREHISKRAFKVCQALGLAQDPPALRLGIAGQIRQRVHKHLEGAGLFPSGNYVVIHPFAGWKFREWSREAFVELAERLVESHGVNVVFLWEEENEGTLQTLRKQFAGNRSVLFASSLSLLGCAVLISGSSLFVGNDSGPLHLASALGVPAVGLFGPSEPSLTAPSVYSPSSWLYHRAECSPCDQRKCTRSMNPCMNLISVEEALTAALALRRSCAHA
jgi:ADP-heptose:LPS heptosyltransferase